MTESPGLVALAETLAATPMDDPAPPALTGDARSGAEHFSRLMSSGEVPPEAIDPVDGSAATAPGNLGDVVLRRLHDVGQGYRNVTGEVFDTLGKVSPNMHLPDLFLLQMEMATASLVVEVVSKG